MKKNLFYLLFIFFVSFVYAEDDFTIEFLDFDPGNNKAEISISSILNMGGVYLGFDNSPKYLSWNTSNLGFIQKPMICLDTLFIPLSISQKKEFTDFSFYDQKLPQNPVIDLKAKQKNGIYEIAFCHPFFDTTIGFLWERPLIGTLESSFNGIFARIKAKDKKTNNSIIFESTLSINIDSLFKLDIFRFGLGKRITPFLNLGWGLNFYQLLASMNLKAEIDAKASLNAGDLIFFNTEKANLNQSIDIQYQKTSCGFNLGGSLYNTKSGLELDFSYNYIPIFDLKGDIISISKIPKFLADKDLTNITKETLTDTVDSKSTFENFLIFRMPSNFNLGFTHKNIFFTTGINFIKYFNPFSITYEKIDEKSENQSNVIFSANPNYSLKLGLDFKLIRFSAGFTNIEEKGKTISIPLASIICSFKIIPPLKINIEIIGIPGPVLKTGFVFAF
ncbi:MAG: hypothetical protein ABIB46_01465 [bacterium]